MGKVLSVATKPFRNYNIESRAHKVISKEKPTAAPKYKSDVLDYERILKDHPEIIEQTAQKDPKLNKHLRDVFVRSHDPQIVEKSDLNKDEPGQRPLPLDRKVVDDFEYGAKEPNQTVYGKTTLRQVIKFITDHQANPKLHNATKISEEYLLAKEKVDVILKYFRAFEVYIPEKRTSKATFAGPSVPRTLIRTIKPKELPIGGKNEKT